MIYDMKNSKRRSRTMIKHKLNSRLVCRLRYRQSETMLPFLFVFKQNCYHVSALGGTWLNLFPCCYLHYVKWDKTWDTMFFLENDTMGQLNVFFSFESSILISIAQFSHLWRQSLNTEIRYGWNLTSSELALGFRRQLKTKTSSKDSHQYGISYLSQISANFSRH